jgi:hypothetical protein
LQNEPITWDTFVLPFDIKNLAKKWVDELWQKCQKDPFSLRMWVLENPKSIFYYVEHAPLDFNISNQDDTPFTLGIQITWQCEMMMKYGQGSSIAFDATFGTNQCRVWHCFPFFEVVYFYILQHSTY